MKKLRLIFCGLMLSVALVGCGASNTDEPGYIMLGGRKFLKIEYGDRLTNNNASIIYVDVNTKVQYLKIGLGRYSTCTVLIDADGKPILYDGEV